MESTWRTAPHRGPAKVVLRNGLRLIECYDCEFAHILPTWAMTAFHDSGPDMQTPAVYEKEKEEVEAGLWDPYFEATARIIGRQEPILDIGAGFGWFVRWATSRGLRAYGTEISPYALKMAPFLFHDEEAYGTFPTLRLNLVLEHIEDPLRFLASLCRRFKPRQVLIVVPNEFNRCQRALRGHWWVSFWHWNYFTPMSLCRLTQKLGWVVRFSTATYPMEWFALFRGLDYIRHPELGRIAHRRRLLMEVSYGPNIFFDLYQQWFRWWRIGREIVYLFEVRGEKWRQFG